MSKSKSKEVTRERAATMLERAIEGSRRLGLDDAADHYEGMSVDDYAEEKGLKFTNPASHSKAKFPERSKTTMATATEDTRPKSEIADENEALKEVGDKVWNYLDSDNSPEAEEICDLLNEIDEDRYPVDDDE